MWGKLQLSRPSQVLSDLQLLIVSSTTHFPPLWRQPDSVGQCPEHLPPLQEAVFPKKVLQGAVLYCISPNNRPKFQSLNILVKIFHLSRYRSVNRHLLWVNQSCDDWSPWALCRLSCQGHFWTFCEALTSTHLLLGASMFYCWLGSLFLLIPGFSSACESQHAGYRAEYLMC